MKSRYLPLVVMAMACASVQPIFAQKQPFNIDFNRADYRVTETKINALVHTKLDVSFDYAKRYMYGKEWLTVKPYFYPTDSLTLDAQGMDIKDVSLVGGKGMTKLKYVYDGEKLKINLTKTYSKDEKYTVYIAYTAKPDELKVKGSAAITDAKGLYFINPDGTDKNKPTQIWTQGETEANSAWFPTIDKPDQKTTDEISMTVQSKYTTLSNGKLVSQKVNKNGTRTDTWRMDLPHAPYLFMMAVGDFKITKDKYKDKEVNYYLEPKYAPYAKQIFGKTPEMIKFYSNTLGVDFPWNKYSQIVVRDYVSGAMENTTATLHGEQVQKTDRELLDGNQESTIAHELFHQWFGDYVTAESWSNITMNESFATFGALIWSGHDGGKDAEDKARYDNLMSYIRSTKNGESPILARFYYDNKEDVFDNISYAKGSVILYALKNQMGDAAFYASLKKYLTDNAFKNGESHQLRLAMEAVTGRDWSPYFNQWYYNGGHPILKVDYGYANGKETINIKQIQDASVQTFLLPLKVDIYVSGKKISKQILIKDREQSFTFDVVSKPDLVDLDADKILVGEIEDNKTLEEYAYQYTHAPSYKNRIEALQFAAKSTYKGDKPFQGATITTSNAAEALLLAGLQDEQGALRAISLRAIDAFTEQAGKKALPVIIQLAKSDKDTEVRAIAITKLSQTGHPEFMQLMVDGVKDRSYKVIVASLTGLARADHKIGINAFDALDANTKKEISGQLGYFYAETGADQYQSYFANIMDNGSKNEVARSISPYIGYLRVNTNPNITEKGLINIEQAIVRLALPKNFSNQLGVALASFAEEKTSQASSANGTEKANFEKQATLFKEAADVLKK